MNQGNFMPPQMPQMPSNQMGGNPNGAPNLSNFSPSQEKMGEWQKSVARSAKIKSATGSIIKTRGDFKAYLIQNGMDLFTSAIEFQQSGDFIMASYIIYRNYNDYKEPLAVFLQRYPQMQQPVIQIRDLLRPAQKDMQVLTPKLSNPNPFGDIAGI
jgi:hypothetical protein